MPARVALSSAGQNGQYVGTTRASPPTAGPGSSSCRFFNGTSDRLLLGPSNSLGEDYRVVFTFWRADSSVLQDNAGAQRLFTQYCVGGPRVAIGLNRSFLSLTYTTSSGAEVTVESRARLLDLQRHLVGVEVASGRVRVFLDGKLAIEQSATLAAPDLARVCVGADTRNRFFRGYIDDLAAFPGTGLNVDNWFRYYRNLVLQRFRRDYIATPFSPGVNSVTLSDEGFAATGFSTTPKSRVSLSSPFRAEPEFPQQFVEFSFQSGSGNVLVGVYGSAHDFANFDIGQTENSFAFDTTGQLWNAGEVINSGLGSWGANDLIAIGWDQQSGRFSLWRNGEQLHSFAVTAGEWTAAVSLGGWTVFLNTGRSPWLSLPQDSQGLPLYAWSLMNTEFRHMRLGEVCAPLNDQGEVVINATNGAAVGNYQSPQVRVGGFTSDSLDYAREVGGGVRIDGGIHSAADDDFFFCLAFTPAEEDLTGEVVIMESPAKWGMRIIDGKLNVWVGDVQVGSVNAPFTAGERYILGMTRSPAGRLLVWTYIGYILQSGDPTVPQTATDVWLGSAADGSKAFNGKFSHLVLSSKRPAAWKLDRLKSVYSWDLPDIEGMIPNPSDVRQVFELSWRDVVAMGIATTPTSSHCYVGAVAEAPDNIAIEYRPVDRKGASAYTGGLIANWCPAGRLLQLLTRTEGRLYLQPGADISGVAVGSPALVDNEVVKVTAVNPTTLVVDVERACIDTIPAEHGAGAIVWFYQGSIGTSGNTYASLDQVDVKLLSRSALAEMGEEFAPVDSVSMVGRLARPYPPAGVTINDMDEPTSLAGTMRVKWLHRNKQSQAATLVSWKEAGIPAPTTVSYRVRAYNADTNELLWESDPIPSTDSDYNLFVDGFTGNLAVTVSSDQGGLECLQVPRFVFSYTWEVIALLNTEEGEPLETEEEDANIEAEFFTSLKAGSYDGELPDDFSGIEEEEEEEEGSGVLADGDHLVGVKISEFGDRAVLTGEEVFPIAVAGTNYKVSLQQFLAWLVQNSPQPENGKNAYQLWLEAGNTGTLEDFFEAYRGYRGLNSNSARRIQVITAASGAIICNWANYDEIRMRLVGDVTLTFQGAVDGQGCLLKFTQDAVGGRNVTLPGTIRYNALVQSYTTTPTPGLSDKIGFIYDTGDSVYDFVTFVPGFST
jgi:hypothetical protein